VIVAPDAAERASLVTLLRGAGLPVGLTSPSLAEIATHGFALLRLLLVDHGRHGALKASLLALTGLRQSGLTTPVLLVTSSQIDAASARRALALDPITILEKPAKPADLIAVARALLTGAAPAVAPRLATLPEGEATILDLLHGRSPASLAAREGINVTVLLRRRDAAFASIGARTILDALRWAIAHGLVPS
jgi:CheY-like chemotaxis protein